MNKLSYAMLWPKRIAILAVAIAGSGCAVPIVSEREVEIKGGETFQEMRASMVESRDAGIRAYVNCVSRPIIDQLEEPYSSLSWEVVVFEDELVNAFALPGGHIGVFTGLLSVAEDQDQLAAVIGHEIAHVTEKHSWEDYNRAITAQGAVIGATAVLGGDNTTYDILSKAVDLGINRPFSRGQETEADVVGLKFMARAGFDPRASVKLWKNMAAAGNGAPPEFLSTHPSSATRISNLVAQLPEALNEFNAAREAGKTPACRR